MQEECTTVWKLRFAMISLQYPPLTELVAMALQGDYGLRVTARGMAGEELMCLDVDFTLAPPS